MSKAQDNTIKLLEDLLFFLAYVINPTTTPLTKHQQKLIKKLAWRCRIALLDLEEL